MPLSRGTRLPLRRLQGAQAVTIFSHCVRPPRERGMTWSKVRSPVAPGTLQYWQVNLSRRNTLNRVKAGRRFAGIYCLSEITLGSAISTDGERTLRSYSDSTITRSRKTALIASCHDQSDRGK